MNKKLLLILSILMSLSLLTMSCAKSVAAPEDIVEGTVGFEYLTDAQLQRALQSIPPITDSGVTFDFSQSTLSPSYDDVTGLTYYTLWVNSYNSQQISKNNILTQLKRVLTEYKGDVIFTPSPSWDSTPSGSYSSSAILTVNVKSSSYNIPSDLRTVKIELYSGGGWN